MTVSIVLLVDTECCVELSQEKVANVEFRLELLIASLIPIDRIIGNPSIRVRMDSSMLLPLPISTPHHEILLYTNHVKSKEEEPFVADSGPKEMAKNCYSDIWVSEHQIKSKQKKKGQQLLLLPDGHLLTSPDYQKLQYEIEIKITNRKCINYQLGRTGFFFLRVASYKTSYRELNDFKLNGEKQYR